MNQNLDQTIWVVLSWRPTPQLAEDLENQGQEKWVVWFIALHPSVSWDAQPNASASAAQLADQCLQINQANI